MESTANVVAPTLSHLQQHDEEPNSSTPPSPLGDAATSQIIRNFFLADKPDAATPVCVAIVVLLLNFKAVDHAAVFSQQRLAGMLGCDLKTIQRALKLLSKLGWVSQPQRKGRTKALTVCIDALPLQNAPRLRPTQEAKELTVRYQDALRRILNRKRFHKNWFKSQFWSAQRILDRCGGDVELARHKIGHALAHPRHARKARKDLYTLFGRWNLVEKTFAESAEKRRLKELAAAEMATQTEVIN
jgi:hypothetical protein